MEMETDIQFPKEQRVNGYHRTVTITPSTHEVQHVINSLWLFYRNIWDLFIAK